MKYIANRTTTLPLMLLFSLASGCGGPMIATEKPFDKVREAITPGKTTREDVHNLMGIPKLETKFEGCAGTWDEIKKCSEARSQTERDWEFYETTGGAVGFVGIIPAPSGDLHHYALITYDESGHVSATDWGGDSGGSAWNRKTLFAGPYGYYVGANTLFHSVDGGGDADTAFATYLSFSAWYQGATGQRKHIAKRNAIEWVCRAAELSHPAAFTEIGNYLWDGLYDFDRDGIEENHDANASELWSTFEKNNVKACVWYSLGNDRVLPAGCRAVLSDDEAAEVEHLLVNWKPSQCESDLAP